MFSKLSAPIPWGVGPNSTSATEPKISSCDFFKTYMTGLNDFTDASTSTPPETGSSATGSATYSGVCYYPPLPFIIIIISQLLLLTIVMPSGFQVQKRYIINTLKRKAYYNFDEFFCDIWE
jgi:hypothetical protein